MAGSLSSSSYADDEPLSDINVTPLVDVTLVLLIVFMITVPAIVGTAPVKVNLPDSTAIPAEIETTPLVFTLRRGAGAQVELYLNEQRTDEPGVRAMFERLGPAGMERDVSISADREIAWDDVVTLIDLLKSLGVEKVALNTRHVETR